MPTMATSSPLGAAGALEMAARARSAPLGRSRLALEMAARARSVPLGLSKWPFEFARLRQSARNCSVWLVENTAPADVSEFEHARPLCDGRYGRSSPLGSAGTLEMAARTRSASPRRSKLLGLARKHCAYQHFRVRPCSGPLGRSTLALDTGARARSAPLGRPKSPLETARLRWTGDASLGRTTTAWCAQHRDEHAPCMVCTGPH